jgi:hypothetical protein
MKEKWMKAITAGRFNIQNRRKNDEPATAAAFSNLEGAYFSYIKPVKIHKIPGVFHQLPRSSNTPKSRCPSESPVNAGLPAN